MQILDPTTGLHVSVDLTARRSRTSTGVKAMAPSPSNSIGDVWIGNNSVLRNKNEIASIATTTARERPES